MHELDDPVIFDSIVASLKLQLGVNEVSKIATGNEFFIFRADLDDGPVVIKVPKDKVFSNVNDAYIDSKVLLDQEYNLSRYVQSKGIKQVAPPINELVAEGYGALVLEFIPSDDSSPNQFKAGVLLASIHSIEQPDIALSAQEEKEAVELVADRLTRRWQELNRLVENLPSLPAKELLSIALESTRGVNQLLHMDFREANFRLKEGYIVAVLDWSNALVAHPALELARVAETGEMGEEFLRGYSSVRALPELDSAIETIFRLDTATMLALVFLSEDPDPVRAPVAVNRVLELHTNLLRELNKI